MQTKWMQTTLFLVGLAALSGAQASAQTDVAASLYGAFNGSTTGNNVAQSPSNAAGALFEIRHIVNPLIGYEGTYSINRANQTYDSVSTVCPLGVSGSCFTTATPVSANAHEVTADWVASLKILSFRPFALAGGGLLFDMPSSGQATTTTVICGPGPAPCVPTTSSTSTSSATKPVFVYGAGLDWGLLPHLGLRFQYRGNLYKAPNLSKLYTSTGAFTHTSEPMIGAYFRF
jgi:opacity protein-like surface antigen